MDLFKKCYDFKLADQYKEMGIYPYFHSLESKQDIVVEMEGKREIMIGSNNYLGLTGNEEVIEASIEATEQFGTGCSGSRFLNGTTTAHLELEKELAEFMQREDCITMSTGFQTNLGIISAIAGRGDVVLCDKENHASIYDAIKLSYADMIRYRHNDMVDLEDKLKHVPEGKGILIVTDGVFSMSGEICKLPEIVELKKKYGARLLVDDAHSFGILGENGRGTGEYFGLEDEVDLVFGTFSKSLASIGGFCVGDHKVIDYIRHNSRPFIFSASITPASVAATRKALEIIKREPERREHLLQISDYMRNALKQRGIKIKEATTPIIPIYTYEPDLTLTACKMLFDRGVYVNPVLPPATPPGECLIRTSYTATHTEELMDEAADIIKDVLTELNIIGEDK
ncbi:MAG: aminotransferase class I/II-fold pyridoxal phosphate-dependent enzyme [Christensenellales bacterium]